jgi:alpha-1,6-mannosyltransferase
MSGETLDRRGLLSPRWVASIPADELARLWRNSALQLLALGLASFGIYEWAFARPYSLFKWWPIPFQTIGKITKFDPQAGAGYTLAFLVLFLFYLFACRLSLGRPRLLNWGVVIGGAIAFNLVLLSLYPVDSADVFDNIIRGRITEQYGGNPIYQIPAAFKSDPFFKYTAWRYFPSAYGPVWESIAAGTARVAGDGVIANVLAFKLVSILAYAASAALIGMTLRRTAPERALYGVTLFAWNPLVLYSTAGNAHNDAVMLFFMVLGLYWFARGHRTLAVLAQVAGALIKFIPALLVPLIVLASLKELSGWRARTRFLLITGGLCAALVAVSYAPFWRGGDVLGLERRTDLFTTSLATLGELILSMVVQAKFADLLVTRAGLILLLAWIVRQVRHLWRCADLDTLLRAAASVLLFYLLIAVPWFEAWYAIWPLAIVALLPDGVWSRGSVLLSLAAGWKMPLFEFVMMIRPGVLPPAIWREPRATLGTLGLPWIFFLLQSLKGKVRLTR